MYRYIIRPHAFLTTPRTLRYALGARRTLCPELSRRTPDWFKDFFLFYPDRVLNSDPAYDEIKYFQSLHKGTQRLYLSQHAIDTPIDFEPHEGKYVVRPHRHHSGIGFRITENAADFNPSSEYISPLFPKRHEYRVIYTRGTRVCTLKKQVSESLRVDQPWNHANGSSFVTVNEESNDRLRHTSVYADLASLYIVKYSHLTGVDVLYSKVGREPAYAVTEVNFCPAMTIPANVSKLKEIVRDQTL